VKKTTTAPTSSTAAVSGGSGGYIVVAGNYLVEGNANTMLQKLKKAGFSNAEKVVFDVSEFHTVIAGRYPSEEAAVKTINNLKSKGIDAYLHRKK
jgi:cell division septation protein DedD